jgi:predicted MFS family arabinose efflux permease
MDADALKVLSRYRVLFALEGFGPLLACAVLARLPSGMFSLAILLFVKGQSGSFLLAGVSVGAFTLTGALGSPGLGQAVDRFGQSKVLIPAAICQCALLIGFLVTVSSGLPAVATVVLAALAGAALPPVSGCIRALWPQIAPGAQALEVAYSLDAISQEIIYTLGPLLVGTVAVLLSPGASLTMCAAITLAGTLLFASSTLSRGQSGGIGERSRGGVLASSGVRALLISAVFGGCVVGAAEVGLPALAIHVGSRASAGVLLALFSTGSMLGGLLYASRAWTASIAVRYVAVLLGLELAMAPLVAVGSLPVAVLLSAVAGIGVAPMLSCQFSLMAALAPAGSATEAFSWHRAATVGGIALGSALGGALVDAAGPGAAFALGCTGAALAAVQAVLGQRRFEPRLSPMGFSPTSSA